MGHASATKGIPRTIVRYRFIRYQKSPCKLAIAQNLYSSPYKSNLDFTLWRPDSRYSRFQIPSLWNLGSRFQPLVEIWIPRAKIPDSRFYRPIFFLVSGVQNPYMGRYNLLITESMNVIKSYRVSASF